MTSGTIYDCLIVGRGLAGSLLAWRLIRRGQRVAVLDDGLRTAASRVAAGLVNPLPGLRFNPSPWVFEWLEAADRLYDELARAAGRPFFHPQPMLRLFRSPEQRRFHDRLTTRRELAPLLGPAFGPGGAGPAIHAPHGGFRQCRTGHLDLPALLDFLGRWLGEAATLREGTADWRTLERTPRGWRLAGIEARHLVCCEGYRAQENPWFAHLPFAPDKGEFLVLTPGEEAGALPRAIVNGAYWLLPHADGRYRLGATHDHHLLDMTPTPEGRHRLEKGLEGLLHHPEILQPVDHQAGVRPATADRRPFLGTHPKTSRLHLFNGFGAHGSLSIPWFSQRMADWLLDGRPLPEAADLRRFPLP